MSSKEITKVFCYRNLNRKGVVWSVKSLKSGLVVDRSSLVILKEVLFKVSQAGRARVLKENRRNVHAGVVGKRIARSPKGTWIKVTYNPYLMDGFRICDGPKNSEPLNVQKARYAKLTPKGLFVLL